MIIAIQFEGAANDDRTIPKRIIVNADRTAIRFVNTHDQVLLHTSNISDDWYPITPEVWDRLLSLCGKKTGWEVTGSMLHLHHFEVHHFMNPSVDTYVACNKLRNWLSKCLPEGTPTYFNYYASHAH